MQAFIWTPQFVTGLERVDAQHQHLFNLINTVGAMLVDGQAGEAALKDLFDELARYAKEHFAEEESLMAQWQLDPRHAQGHAAHHREFVEQLLGMWAQRGHSNNTPALLHSFLASWLTMHILGEDQRMARMMAAMGRGRSAAEAYAEEHASSDPGVTALLGALYQLYGLLASQNRALGDSNRQLESRVAERTQSLAQAHDRLQTEHAKLRAALAQIEASNQQLLQAEKMASLGRLIAGFAHEMNTPMGVAVGATSNAEVVLSRVDRLLAQEDVDAQSLLSSLAELREGNALALKNLLRASELVQRIRQNTLDSGMAEQQSFALRSCIDDVLTRAKAALQQRGVAVRVDCADTLAVCGQPLHYEQLLTALLDNALRHAFAPEVQAPQLQLCARRTPAALEIRCSDNGVGIPKALLAHVFEPFFTTQRSAGRPGLGLYLCYNLVTGKLGGSIACAPAPGGGTTFTLSIPMAEPEKAQP